MRERLQLRAQGRGHRRNRRGEALLCLAEFLAVMACMGKSTKPLRSRTHGRWYFCAILLKGLTPHLQDMSAKLRPFIQQEHAMMRQGDLARHRELAATDQPDIGNGVMRGATRAPGHHCRAGTGEAGHVMDARGLQGFGETHGRHNGGQPACQHRLPYPRWPQEHMMVRTPASDLVLRL
jgi:hypothetical protein